MVMVCNCMYVCVFNFVVFTSHMFLICLTLIVFSLCRRNVTHHYAMSVLISDKRSPGVFILCFRNVTHYLTITELISTKPLSAVAIMNQLSIDVVNFMWSAIFCQIRHGEVSNMFTIYFTTCQKGTMCYL